MESEIFLAVALKTESIHNNRMGKNYRCKDLFTIRV